MNIVLGLLCAAGFVAAIVVHVGTFFGASELGSGGRLWLLLHVGAIAAGGALAVYARADFGSDYRIWRHYPRWAVFALASAMLYTAINFALFMGHVREGQVQLRDGRYAIYDHGRFVRASSLEEYRQQQIYFARGFSGHWMLFYLGPALYFLTRRQSTANQA